MNALSTALCAAVLLQAVASEPPKVATPKKASKQATTAKKRESPSSWFARVLKIDPRAYANLTAFRRGGRTFDAARSLMSFDRATGREETLWECDSCWAPTVVDGGVAVLRHAEKAAVELWLVPAKGSPRRIAAVDGAVTIAGASGKRIFAAVNTPECADSEEGPYGLVEIDLAGRTRRDRGGPCFGTIGLTAAGRVRGDRLLGTTSKTDLTGRRHPRQILIYTPATGEAPEAVLFDDRLTGNVERFDPVWLSDDRIVYIADR